MAKPFVVRRGWLKFMYGYTIVGAGGFGLGIVLMPKAIRGVLGWPGGDPLAVGVMGSVYVAFAALSVLGLRDPLKLAPVLLLQLCYKSVWFAGVVVPLALTGRFQDYGIYGVLIAVLFATYIIGDLIAIPFRYLLAPASSTQPSAA